MYAYIHTEYEMIWSMYDTCNEFMTPYGADVRSMIRIFTQEYSTVISIQHITYSILLLLLLLFTK